MAASFFLHDIRCFYYFCNLGILDTSYEFIFVDNSNTILIEFLKKTDFKRINFIHEELPDCKLLFSRYPIYLQYKTKLLKYKTLIELISWIYAHTIGRFLNNFRLQNCFSKFGLPPLTLGGGFRIFKIRYKVLRQPIRIASKQIMILRSLDSDLSSIRDTVDETFDGYIANSKYDRNILDKITSKPIYLMNPIANNKKMSNQTQDITKLIIKPHNFMLLQNFICWKPIFDKLLGSFDVFFKPHPEIDSLVLKKYEHFLKNLGKSGYTILWEQADYEKLLKSNCLHALDGGGSLFSALKANYPFFIFKPNLDYSKRNLPDIFLETFPVVNLDSNASGIIKNLLINGTLIHTQQELKHRVREYYDMNSEYSLNLDLFIKN
jgi:hypothetical protein